MIKRKRNFRGKVKDTAAKILLKNKAIIADICNACIYGGEQILNEDKLDEVPVELNSVGWRGDGSLVADKREMDLSYLAYTDGAVGYFICIEVQARSDPIMPIRVMDYNARQYYLQAQELLRRKAGRILPVATMVLNLGRDIWKGPRNLHEMFGKIDDKLKAFVPDYALNIIDPYAMDEKTLDSLCTEIKHVLNCFRVSGDGEKLLKLYPEGCSVYLSENAVNVLNEYLKMGLEMTNKGGKVEMCRAVRQLIEKGRVLGIEQGIEKGIEQGRKQGFRRANENVVINGLRMNLSHADIQRLTGLSLEQIKSISQKASIEN